MTLGRNAPVNVTVGTLVLSLVASVVRAGALFAAHIASGSSALLTAAVHALIEASSQMFMLTGEARLRSRSELWREPRATDELTFWGPVVGTLLYALGAGVAIFEGVRSIVAPRGLDKSDAALLALAAAILTTVVLLWQLRMLVRRSLPADAGPTLPRSLGPVVVNTLGMELRAGLVGLSIAAFGIVLASRLGVVGADSAASIAVGLVMAVTAASFAVEVKAILARDSAAAAPLSDDTSKTDGEGHPAAAKPNGAAPTPEMPAIARMSEGKAISGVAVVAGQQSAAPHVLAKAAQSPQFAGEDATDGFPGDDEPPTGGTSSASRKTRKKARRRHS
jgi:hypothetical protein